MMSRASKVLMWVGAATVLLTAAPIAYAISSPAPRHPDPEPPARSAARCGAGPEDYAGTYVTAGLSRAAYRFDLTAMLVTMQPYLGQPYLGTPAPPATWQAGDGAISWSVDGVTYSSKPGTTECADSSSATTVTAFTAGSADGSHTLVLRRR